MCCEEGDSRKQDDCWHLKKATWLLSDRGKRLFGTYVNYWRDIGDFNFEAKNDGIPHQRCRINLLGLKNLNMSNSIFFFFAP